MALPVSRNVIDWPDILCGPILRRVTPTSVAVFIALKAKARVRLELYKRLSPGNYDAPLQSIGYDTIALGANLHVCVAEWRSGSPLAANQIYGYDLLLTVPPGPGGVDRRLGDLTPNLLAEPYKLGYDERLPSFVLPPNLRDLVVAHGSCRKPHGNKPDAGPDALAVLDDLIAGGYRVPLQRPHHLILTGDQIYADDVSGALLATLRATAADLLGWAQDETFPPAVSGGARITPQDSLVIPGPKRRDYIRKRTKLSSGAVDGHLMFLGEFYAMYLLTWSDDLWPRETGVVNPSIRLPEARELRPVIFPNVQTLTSDEQAYLNEIDAGRANAHPFAASLPRVRRALANVPSMTMFDDHEVTDDWYVHGEWDSDVRADPASRQIVRNALACYAIFQDWGNHPENYRSGTLGQQILAALTFVEPSRLPPIESQPSMLDALLDIRPQRTALAQRMRWDWQYSLPNADYQIIALDTRTFRSFPAVNQDAPGLIASDSTKTDAQLIQDSVPLGLQLLARKPADGRVTILLSPAPVLGHPLVEAGQRVAVMGVANSVVTYETQLVDAQAELARLNASPPFLLKQFQIDRLTKKIAELPATIAAAKAAAPNAAATSDREAWSANRAAFEELLRRLSGFGRVVILSGDVHYASSMEMAYFRTAPSATPARIVQLCSSALRNENEETRLLANVGFEAMQTTLGWLGFDRSLTALTADFKSGLDLRILSEGVDPALASDASRLLFKFEELLKQPAVIPSAHYIDKTVFSKVRDLARDPADQRDLTNWRYSITYLRDTRNVASRTANWSALASALGVSPSLAHRNRMLVGSSRSIVGQNNIGVVRFSASVTGGTIDQVTHRLHWQVVAGGAGQAQIFTMFTDHLAKLSFPTDDERPEVMP